MSATAAPPRSEPVRKRERAMQPSREVPSPPRQKRPIHRGPQWLWVLVTLAMVAAMVYVRVFVFPDRVVPLAYALPLLVSLWNRNLYLLWFMGVTFSLLVLTKVLVVIPTWELSGGERAIFGAMHLSSILVVAGVIDRVVRLSVKLESNLEQLELANAELEASNEELAAREEEISQQNEELQQQAEELEQQTEELGAQTEELQAANQVITARERVLNELLDVSSADLGEDETMERLGHLMKQLLGPRAIAAAVLERNDGSFVVNPLFGGLVEGQRLVRERSMAGVVLARGQPGFLADVSLREDLDVPKLAGSQRVASILAAPYCARAADVAGVLEVYSDSAGEWSEEHLRLAHWAAEQCGRIWQSARLREELANHRGLLRTMSDNSTVGLFMLDAEGRCTFMNPAAERKLGRSYAEVRGQPLHDLVHVHSADEPCELARAIAEHTGLRDFETEVVRRDGSHLSARCSASPVLVDGKADSIVLEIRDITNEKRQQREREAILEMERAARAEADRAGRAKDEFVATLSHELRTPLNAILGWSSLLRNVTDPIELDKGLEIIERNARAQGQLISDLLDISRITAGRMRLEMRTVDPGAVAESALDAIRPAADARGVRLEAALESPGAVLVGDSARLQQIVWNLLSNAVKFTPRGGLVRLELHRAGDCVELLVHDTGQGIEPDLLPLLFERYRQGDSSPTRHQGGLGLGLAIVKHLVELHGGTVSLKSNGKGCGTTCKVVLPLGSAAVPECVDRPDEAPAAALPSLQGVSVLIVDDDADSRELAGRILADQGASVRWAGSAAEAEDAIRIRRPDVLLSDLGMPGMDGYQLVRRLRREIPSSVMPAVAVTAFARAEDRARAMDAGFQGHIAKPLEARDLVQVVAELRPRQGADEEGTVA